MTNLKNLSKKKDIGFGMIDHRYANNQSPQSKHSHNASASSSFESGGDIF